MKWLWLAVLLPLCLRGVVGSAEEASGVWKIETWGKKARPIPIEERLPGPPLTLANEAPETIKFARELRMLWFKDVYIPENSLEYVLSVISAAVARNHPGGPKVRFQIQYGGSLPLGVSIPIAPLTNTLRGWEKPLGIEFAVDHDVILVRQKTGGKPVHQ